MRPALPSTNIHAIINTNLAHQMKEILENPEAFAAASAAAAAAAAPAAGASGKKAAPVAAKKAETEEESEEDMGFGLFD